MCAFEAHLNPKLNLNRPVNAEVVRRACVHLRRASTPKLNLNRPVNAGVEALREFGF